MRSTAAAAAIRRLNERVTDKHYVMISTGAGLFILGEQQEDGSETLVSQPMDLEGFVVYVDGLGPQKQRRMTKNDIAFEKQLVKKNKPAGEDEG